MSPSTLKDPRTEKPAIDATVGEALALLLEPGTVTELRALGTAQGTVSGYFNDPSTMTKAAARLSGKAEGIYFTLNPVNPVLLGRASNRVKPYAKHTAGDADVLHRRWLLLDFDPKRPAGVSSTDEEHRLALERAAECRELLSGSGLAAPILADSGNGAHLLYRLDLPNDADGTSLVGRVLDALALRFSDEDIELDTNTFNAARISKVYGTLAAKGDSIPKRPHRHSKILQYPAQLEVITREQLSALPMPEAPPPVSQQRRGQAFDMAEWLAKNGIDVVRQKPWHGGTCYILGVCPNNAEHNRSEAVVLKFANGGIAAKCQHVSCGLNWKSLRERFERQGANLKVQPSVVWAAATGAGGALPEANDWPDAEPLGGELPPVPALDLELLPCALRPLVADISERMQAPPEYAAVAATVSLAGCFGRRAPIQPKLQDTAWRVVPNLWGAMIAPPGFMKSPILRAITLIEEGWRAKYESA